MRVAKELPPVTLAQHDEAAVGQHSDMAARQQHRVGDFLALEGVHRGGGLRGGAAGRQQGEARDDQEPAGELDGDHAVSQTVVGVDGATVSARAVKPASSAVRDARCSERPRPRVGYRMVLSC